MSSSNTPYKPKRKIKTINYAARILDILQQDRQSSYTMQQLCSILKTMEHVNKAKIKKALSDLVHQGKVTKKPKGGYLWRDHDAYLIGQVDYVRTEYAYIIIPEQQKDIFVLQKNLFSALDKDVVKVRLLPEGRRKRPEGIVVEIIKRNSVPIIGRITEVGKQTKALVEQRKFTYEVLLTDVDQTALQKNDKVVIALALSPEKTAPLTGSIAKHLGQAGLHDVEMHAIMAEFDLNDAFPENVLASMHNISTVISSDEIGLRRDFRAIPTFTIDPADAKDLDDALSYQQLPNGCHQVGIHIADVSHYVLPDTLLDQEAYKRNTSVYLVDRCIPMLPELLSNELCSLQPNGTKLAFSVVFELDDSGKVQHQWFGETVIESKKKLSYEEAQSIIATKTGQFYQELSQLNHIAQQLRIRRLEKGAINFETRELVFNIDNHGQTLSISPKIRLDTHKLIEEFMLLANQQVATYVARMKEKKEEDACTFIYRTHDEPDPDKLNAFYLFVQQLGYKVKLGEKPVYKVMHYLEKAAQGKQEENIIQSLAIRAMAKALYTTAPNPHFALAFTHYTHFTSPIRRYSDLLAHRLFKRYLKGERIYDSSFYEKKCQYAIEREYIAISAERASIKYKQIEFIQNLKDEILEGIISGVTEWNIYVEITANGCEGIVHLTDLTDDKYIFDEKNYQIIGHNTQRCYRLGNIVHVKIKHCDLNRRYVNFWLMPAKPPTKTTA